MSQLLSVLDVIESTGCPYWLEGGVLDERPTRIELVAADGGCVDLHPLQLDPSGDARQQAPDGSWWHFRREWFTTGYLENRLVPCYTAEGQRHFHSGYELRDVDLRDLATLDALAARAD